MMITVKPREGLKVRKEIGGHFAAEGEPVEDSTYIRRRIKAGDLVEIREAKPARQAKKEA